MSVKKSLTHLWIAASLCLSSAMAVAQTFTKPIRLVIPFAAGGNPDLIARLVAPGVAEIVKQPVVVENRTGAGGMIAGEFVGKSAPDGHTLLVGSTGSVVIAPLTFRRAELEWDRILMPVGSLGLVPVVFHVRPELPVRNLQELIAYAKSREGKMTAADGGAGSVNHLAGELLQLMSNSKWTHVHHKGIAPAISDVLGGHIDVMISQVNGTMQHIQQGRLRALATTGPTRLRQLPDLPTMQEAGYKDFLAVTFIGVLAPQQTPRATINDLNSAFGRVIKDGGIAAKFDATGTDVYGGSPEEFSQFLKSETDRWRKVVISANIKAE
ncbi:MAG: Bug family tripartite tricarboxylate transporter substrate binding protein [Burkholderiales bacterium]